VRSDGQSKRSCLCTPTMSPLNVKIKNAGKTFDVVLDVGQSPAGFKEAIYQKTGIPPDRMKVMIKGGMLKVSTRVLLFHFT
jgi:ubiquitin carboxyl-terminal hydrolase 14